MAVAKSIFKSIFKGYGRGFAGGETTGPDQANLLGYYPNSPIVDGKLIARAPASSHTTQQVKGSGFAGAGIATVTGLLTTDTITATGDAPTCSVDGTLTFPGPDCWDIEVFRDGVRWASWKGINVGHATELDASGNGHHLVGIVGTTITELLDGSGTNYANEMGFSARSNVLTYSNVYATKWVILYNTSGTASINGSIVHLGPGDGIRRHPVGIKANKTYICGFYGATTEGNKVLMRMTTDNVAFDNKNCGLSLNSYSPYMVFTTGALAAPDTALFLIINQAGNAPVTLNLDNIFIAEANTPTNLGSIVCIGDSLTGSDIPVHMAKLLSSSTLIDKGVPGDTLVGMNNRFNADVIGVNHDGGVVIIGGLNDCFADTPVETIQSAVSDMVSKAKTASITPIVLGNITPFKGSESWTQGRQNIADTVNAWLPGFAANNGCIFKDLNALANDGLDAIMVSMDAGDHIHYLEFGYQVFASELASVFERELPFNIITQASAITGRQPAGFQSFTDYPGPLGIDGPFDGTTFPTGNFKAPLGAEFQAIPEFTNNASVDLATLPPTPKIRIGPRGMIVRSVDGSAAEQARDDRVVGA